MFALGLDSNPLFPSDQDRESPARLRAPRSTRLKALPGASLHESFVMKAEAFFPGSEIVSHQSPNP